MIDTKEETGKSLPDSNTMQHKTKEEQYSGPIFVIVARTIEVLIPLLLAWLWNANPKAAVNELLWVEGASRVMKSTEAKAFLTTQQGLQVSSLWSSSLPTWNIVVSMFTSAVALLRAFSYERDNVNLALVDLILNIHMLPLWSISLLALLFNKNCFFPDYPSRFPWYLVSDCATAHLGAQSACRTAQATFGITCLMVLLYGTWIVKTVVVEVWEFMKRRRHQAVELL